MTFPIQTTKCIKMRQVSCLDKTTSVIHRYSLLGQMMSNALLMIQFLFEYGSSPLLWNIHRKKKHLTGAQPRPPETAHVVTPPPAPPRARSGGTGSETWGNSPGKRWFSSHEKLHVGWGFPIAIGPCFWLNHTFSECSHARFFLAPRGAGKELWSVMIMSTNTAWHCHVHVYDNHSNRICIVWHRINGSGNSPSWSCVDSL